MEEFIRYRGYGSNQNKTIYVEEKFTLPVEEFQRAWFAGLMDAEGTFTIRVAEQSATVALYNNNVALLEDVIVQFGVGKSEKVLRKSRSDNHADSYQIPWQSQKDVCKIIAIVKPYLRLKLKPAELLQQSCLSSRIDRAPIIKEVHALNAKGQQFEFSEIGGDTVKVDLEAITDIQWAYFAGYCEGDGCFVLQPQYFNQTTYLYPWVMLTGTKGSYFLALQKEFGGYLTSRKEEHIPENWAPKVELRIQDQDTVEPFLKKLRPFIRSRGAEIDTLLDSFSVEAKDREPFRQKLFKLRGRHPQ